MWKEVEYYLRQRQTPVSIEVFSDVEPDPSTTTVERGTCNDEQIPSRIALSHSAAVPLWMLPKAMWLFYEYPDQTLIGLKQKFMDIRKRVYKYPRLGNKAKFVAIPTTSGTGSEVTSFAVITDKNKAIRNIHWLIMS